ncbi:MAG: PEP-CTERM sorting domain-containing protein [Planctomycetes bacterium]|nr:PEP-CTERM sorting domain-containing protein [Planctomycetota bacterium]
MIRGVLLPCLAILAGMAVSVSAATLTFEGGSFDATGSWAGGPSAGLPMMSYGSAGSVSTDGTLGNRSTLYDYRITQTGGTIRGSAASERRGTGWDHKFSGGSYDLQGGILTRSKHQDIAFDGGNTLTMSAGEIRAKDLVLGSTAILSGGQFVGLDATSSFVVGPDSTTDISGTWSMVASDFQATAPGPSQNFATLNFSSAWEGSITLTSTTNGGELFPDPTDPGIVSYLGWDEAVEKELIMIDNKPVGASGADFTYAAGAEDPLNPGNFTTIITIEGVPEPATVALFGLGALLLKRRRRLV